MPPNDPPQARLLAQRDSLQPVRAGRATRPASKLVPLVGHHFSFNTRRLLSAARQIRRLQHVRYQTISGAASGFQHAGHARDWSNRYSPSTPSAVPARDSVPFSTHDRRIRSPAPPPPDGQILGVHGITVSFQHVGPGPVANRAPGGVGLRFQHGAVAEVVGKPPPAAPSTSCPAGQDRHHSRSAIPTRRGIYPSAASALQHVSRPFPSSPLASWFQHAAVVGHPQVTHLGPHCQLALTAPYSNTSPGASGPPRSSPPLEASPRPESALAFQHKVVGVAHHREGNRSVVRPDLHAPTRSGGTTPTACSRWAPIPPRACSNTWWWVHPTAGRWRYSADSARTPLQRTAVEWDRRQVANSDRFAWVHATLQHVVVKQGRLVDRHRARGASTHGGGSTSQPGLQWHCHPQAHRASTRGGGSTPPPVGAHGRALGDVGASTRGGGSTPPPNVALHSGRWCTVLQHTAAGPPHHRAAPRTQGTTGPSCFNTAVGPPRVSRVVSPQAGLQHVRGRRPTSGAGRRSGATCCFNTRRPSTMPLTFQHAAEGGPTAGRHALAERRFQHVVAGLPRRRLTFDESLEVARVQLQHAAAGLPPPPVPLNRVRFRSDKLQHAAVGLPHRRARAERPTWLDLPVPTRGGGSTPPPVQAQVWLISRPTLLQHVVVAMGLPHHRYRGAEGFNAWQRVRPAAGKVRS